MVSTCGDYMCGGRGILPETMILLEERTSVNMNRAISTYRFDSNDCEIVVARYNESVDWLRCFEPRMLRIYNKGTSLESIPNTVLPNVGREAHTYLQHIVNHYDQLSPYVMFTQAGLTNNEGCLTNPFDFVTELIESCVHNLGLSRNYKRYDDSFPTPYEMTEFKACDRSSMVFGAWFEKFVKEPFETNPKWFKGAVMCVSRALIRSRERSYYIKLLDTVSSHINPEEAYYLERSWYYVFQQRRVFHCFGLTKGGGWLFVLSPICTISWMSSLCWTRQIASKIYVTTLLPTSPKYIILESHNLSITKAQTTVYCKRSSRGSSNPTMTI